MKRIIQTLIVGLAVHLGAVVLNASIISVAAGDINTNTTWTTGNEYVVEGYVYVTGGATLTVQPGVIIRGQPRSSSTNYDTGCLIISREGTINAQGTSANPIIFTTATVDNNADGNWDDVNSDGTPDRWTAGATFHDDSPLSSPLLLRNPNGTSNFALTGGIIVLGYAPNNVDNVSGLNRGERYIGTIPQDSRTIYGGNNPNDSSGVIRYMSIRHGGGYSGTNGIINGLTLASVGYGTLIEYVEVYCQLDDGIKFFGGTVNTRYLVSAYVNDDGFSMDEGYTGLGQFWFYLATDDTAIGDNAVEGEGDHESDSFPDANLYNALRTPLAYPVIHNATMVGPGSAGKTTRCLLNRHNFGGNFLNCIFAEFKGKALKVSDSDIPTNSTQLRMTAGELLYNRNVFWNFNFTGGAYTNTAATIGNSSYEERVWDGTDAAQLNDITNPGFSAFNRAIPNGVNPRPIQSGQGGNVAAILGNLAPYTSTFLTPATYKGAFSTNPNTRLWTYQWTALNQCGVLVH